MATPIIFPGFKERVHSDTWWKVKTGWSDAELLSRKNALLSRIREKLPYNSEELNYHDLADVIDSLVATFDDSGWCLLGEHDRTVVFAEQLRLYTKWTQVIRSDRYFVSGTEMYTMSPSTASLSIPLLATHPNSLAVSTSQPAKENEYEITSMTEGHIAIADKGTIPIVAEKQAFDWNDVEVRIKVVIPYSTNKTYYFPMTVLGTGEVDKPCHWDNFSRSRFIEYCRCATLFSPSSYNLFWIDGKQWANINCDGAFKLMLKRFSEKPGTNSGLRLQFCSEDKPTGNGLLATQRSLFRKPTLY